MLHLAEKNLVFPLQTVENLDTSIYLACLLTLIAIDRRG